MISPALISALGLLASAPYLPSFARGADDVVERSTSDEAPQDVAITRFDGTRADGTPVWGASADYELSTGDIVEVYLEADGSGGAELSISINGEAVARTRYDSLTSDGPTMTSWISPTIDYAPSVLAEVMEAAGTKDIAHQIIPLSFPCSDFGKKALKGAKYVWLGAVAAFGVACCAATEGVGCGACAVGSTVLGEAGADALEGYCE